MTERETYVENMKLELDQLNDQLSSLETKVQHGPPGERDRHQSDLLKLRTHADDALSKWEELEAASEGSWHQWVSDMDRLRDALIHGLHRVHDGRSRL